MKKVSHLSIASLLLTALVFAGCSGGSSKSSAPELLGVVQEMDSMQALVINQSSNNISAVDLADGTVTSDMGELTIGPIANSVAVRGDKAYIVNSGDTVQVIDLITNTVENTIPFPAGDNPWDIAFVSDTRAYVTCLYGNYVAVIDPTQNGASAILRTISLPVFDGPDGPVNAGPEGIIIAKGYAYTANTGFVGCDPVTYSCTYITGSVTVIDTATDTIVDTDGDPSNGTDTPIFTTGLNPQDLDEDSEGEINVICTGDYWSEFGVLDVIDPGTWSVTESIPLGGSPGNITIGNDVALMGAGDTNGCNLYVINTDTNEAEYDSTNPLNLMVPSGWCTVGKIAMGAMGDAAYAYAPAGVFFAEAKLFELSLDQLEITQTFDLEPSANLPNAVSLY